jgi:hypothetical protein
MALCVILWKGREMRIKKKNQSQQEKTQVKAQQADTEKYGRLFHEFPLSCLAGVHGFSCHQKKLAFSPLPKSELLVPGSVR